MQMSIRQETIEQRNKDITHAKVTAITDIMSKAEGLFHGSQQYANERKKLQIEKLDGHDHYALRDGIEKFLVGSGEGTGFIGQILAAQDTEEFRAVVNSYGIGSMGAPEKMEPSVDNILAHVKDWLARNAWMDLQFALKPLRSEMASAAGMTIQPS